MHRKAGESAHRSGARSDDRRITRFSEDEHGDWVAELECGHTQHVRHDPPWQNRDWVTTPAGRASRIGRAIPCPDCDLLRRGRAD